MGLRLVAERPEKFASNKYQHTPYAGYRTNVCADRLTRNSRGHMKQRIVFDIGLIRRYDQSGPRYTSYPTAAQFHDGISEKDYVAVGAPQQRGSDSPTALDLHPYSLLRHGVLLLCLQQGGHQESCPRHGLPGSSVPGNRHAGKIVRPRPGGRTTALGRRHADVPGNRPDARPDGENRAALYPRRERQR